MLKILLLPYVDQKEDDTKKICDFIEPLPDVGICVRSGQSFLEKLAHQIKSYYGRFAFHVGACQAGLKNL